MFWHTKSIKELMLELDTSVNGLSQEKAAQRLNESGKNQFESKKKKSFLKKLALCFWDKMTCILFIAAAVSYTVSRIAGESSIDAFIILAIVFLNGIVGAIQETKAEKSLEALKKLSSPETSVLRDGKKIRIPSCDTVCGDLIFLEKGCFVSADARVIESTALSTQESALTGEPNAVFKTSETLPQGDGHITSMHNIVWSGTSVVSGYGKAIVVATGMKSYVGTIAKMLDENETAKTPLQKKLAKTSGILGNAALLICLLIFIVSLLKGFAPAEMFLTGVSLAVAAIPEGLPAIVTIMLSFGVTKMVKRKAIVKKLPAVETLGCATVICSDKTGTLTQNKMKVSEIFGEQSITCSLFLLNNNFSSPTELALSEYAASHGADQKKIYAQNPRIAEIPFDSKTKLMATLHKTKTGYLAIIKGAPEIISCCIDDYPQNNG
ncbi:MAG: HAD-IC family P-type ATPase, partial [Clostridia bacterium]